MLVDMLQQEVPSASRSPSYPTWIKNALTLLLSTHKESLPENCRQLLKQFLEDETLATALVADVLFLQTSEAGRFSALYRRLQPAFELLSTEAMLSSIGSIVSKRFCHCAAEEQRHGNTLIEFVNVHATDITSDAFDTVAKHLMTVVDDLLRSVIPIISLAQLVASVLFSPQFSIAASNELVAIRRSWIADQLDQPDRTHVLLHLISARRGFGRPQLTTIVHIILEIIITDGKFVSNTSANITELVCF